MSIIELALPLMLLLGACLVALEHRFPAHPIQAEREWYVRALIVNALQLLVFVGVDHLWGAWSERWELLARVVLRERRSLP